MGKSTTISMVKLDCNLVSIYHKKTDSVLHSIHLAKFNGIRMFGNGPVIFSEECNIDTVAGAISVNEEKIKIEFYPSEDGSEPRVKRISIGEISTIIIDYNNDDNTADVYMKIEVDIIGSSPMQYLLQLHDNEILVAAISNDSNIYSKSFIHNGEEVFEIR